MTRQSGIALLAVLFALTLLALLALPFAVSMSAGADASVRAVERAQVEQASASVRELLLADAVLSHSALDETPLHDAAFEFPDRCEVRPAFAPLQEEGRVQLGGEVWDLQRYFLLDAASPLLFANVLGTTTRLAADLLPDATMMVVEDASLLPESGYLWLAHEVLRYGSKDGNRLLELERSLFRDQGFVLQEESIRATSLLLDYRCILAAAWPYLGRSQGTRTSRSPFSAIGELNEIAAANCGRFSLAELDRLQAAFSVVGMADTAGTWGKPERVFDSLRANLDRSLRVKSALHIGAGSTIRLTNLLTGEREYGLVMSVGTERSQQDLLLPRVYRLVLLHPVAREFPAEQTLIEPLLPPAVNLNTASQVVLKALFQQVRRSIDVRVPQANGQGTTNLPLAISNSLAGQLAEQICALRAGDGTDLGTGPLQGWKDLIDRVLQPHLAEASESERNMWLMLYRNLETGRDSGLEMGTAPAAFRSAPLVGYRAAASRSRSTAAAGVAARHERTGIAAVAPGFRVQRRWDTQQLLEEAFRLDRRAPFYITTPENLGALLPNDPGSDPAGRYAPHLLPILYPAAGFGLARYGSTDPADAAFRPAPATIRLGGVPGEASAWESFTMSADPRGHDVAREGAYRIANSGSRGGQAQGQSAPAATQQRQGGGRHDRISLPFSEGNGFAARFAASFWAEPQTLQGVTLFDHSDGDAERNRIALLARDGNLLLEVIDEAGLDPDPQQSPAGVERTAAQASVPIASLGLPADTPVHLSLSAYGSRASDLSLFVDGMTRSTAKFTTRLAAALPAYDPTLSNNSQFPPTGSNDKYLDIAVESTDGFPPVGVLRIGTELFEYTAIAGNSFQCQWRDSLGGRGARQMAREHRPDIPADANGKPTVDIDSLQQQGINLDVFPEHPAGAEVELYGYSALVSEDVAMMVGSTQLDGSVGAFSVARGFLSNPRPITITGPGLPTINLGRGIDTTWTGDLELADPVPTTNYPPNASSQEIADGFPSGGGYALIVQRRMRFESNVPGQVMQSAEVGGVELIRYTSRSGTKLSGVQRAQTLPGNDNQIDSSQYQAATARQFVCEWPRWNLPNQNLTWNDIPTLIVWVVPISLPMQNTGALWDPAASLLTEWVQLYPNGNDVDTEWVRYDAIADNRHIVRGNRAAWESLRYTLTRTLGIERAQIGPLGPSQGLSGQLTAPWGQVTATSGYIGYVPTLESTYPQIHAARMSLSFRGDAFSRTSSHPQSNTTVMQCQRLQLPWGNYGALSGRVGRHDRVALVQGSMASGTTRPTVEWHTVNWQANRYNSDNYSQNRNPAERLGPWPFQLVAFRLGVSSPLLGPPMGTAMLDSRQYDRVVKFPSGELPAAFCEEVAVGSSVASASPLPGFVDEIDVLRHNTVPMLLEEACNDSAQQFRVLMHVTLSGAGTIGYTNDLSARFPQEGGLVQIGDEILAYQSRSDGLFTVATNGRGLLNTQARTHDKGARVHFLTHRAAAILSSGIGARDHSLPLQGLGRLPSYGGALLVGREIVHYAWGRTSGSQVSLEMPAWYPSGQYGNNATARGLFRGRFGTSSQSLSKGEAVIHWPIRYWDRYADRSDDPELAYFQLTLQEAPTFFRGVRWREQTQDASVGVVCLARSQPHVGWDAEPGPGTGLQLLTRTPGESNPSRIAAQGNRLELRFATTYAPGSVDLTAFLAHAWKTTARIDQVAVDCDGQTRILDEQVTSR